MDGISRKPKELTKPEGNRSSLKYRTLLDVNLDTRVLRCWWQGYLPLSDSIVIAARLDLMLIQCDVGIYAFGLVELMRW